MYLCPVVNPQSERVTGQSLWDVMNTVHLQTGFICQRQRKTENKDSERQYVNLNQLTG